MNFAERFKGKTSIMTKEGVSALVQSSQVPIFKTTGMQGMAPPDASRQASYLDTIAASQSNMKRPLPSQQKKRMPKYPSTWPPVASDQDHAPKLSNLQALRPAKTQNNTPLTDRGITMPSLNRHSSALTESDSPERAIIHLSGFAKNVRQGHNEQVQGPQNPGGPVLRRSQSTVKERVLTSNDYPNSTIHPSYGEMARSIGKIIIVRKKSDSRESPVRVNSRHSEEVIYTENQERNSQLSNRDDSPNQFRRAISHRELIDKEVYSRQHFYRNQPQKVPEDSIMTQFIEANVAKYSGLNLLSHNKSVPLKVGSCQSLENDSDQKSGIMGMIEKRRDMTPGPTERPISNRNPEISRQILQTINQRIGKTETRVNFRGEDIIDKLRLQSEDRLRRSNSNDSFVRAQSLRFTGRRMEKAEITKA